MKRRLALAIAIGIAAPSLAFAHGLVRTDEELIKVLQTAAPAKIVANATIMNTAADGTMKVIQKGTNGWTCMDPGTHHTGEPMCADAAAMAWADAWQNKKPPTAAVGFMYMLNGDSGVSNTDPYDHNTEATPTNNWIQTGPHVMIVGTDAKTMLETYPRDAKADPTVPYVMWPGTPYEHLMLPLK
ncbi:conserved exported hypothetical protein [Hyphomicrobium sp. GJ21]|jgi:hypothetical protein|uniref:hypothetical protein n=1 Tax=Hyphomicrobium sp. GJ21 TaxID=113574 RepID=UPI000622BE36|nr:hypothetical protein [Hyphomicrobium sp. GJ21]CEJ86319.1 conserved exported hypothetical protein [Hyphomicrobium sp. GJ21]